MRTRWRGQGRGTRGFRVLAIALAECGQLEEARAEVDRFLALWPASMEAFVENLQRWFFADPELSERLHQSLVNAGLEFSPNLWPAL